MATPAIPLAYCAPSPGSTLAGVTVTSGMMASFGKTPQTRQFLFPFLRLIVCQGGDEADIAEIILHQAIGMQPEMLHGLRPGNERLQSGQDLFLYAQRLAC